MTVHRAYGLTIDSDVALPALPLGEGVPDITIRRASVTIPAGIERVRGDGPFVVSAQHIVFAAAEGACAVLDGHEIVVDPAPQVDGPALQAWLLSRAFAALLHQRGHFVLHADTVGLARGGAVAFTGASGSGKSTTAAAFCRAGHALVAEDVSALQSSDRGFEVLAGYPSLKLAHAGAIEKQPVAFPTGFETAARELHAIFVLHDGPSVALEPIARADAARVAMVNAFGFAVFGDAQARDLLTAAATVARRGTVMRLVRPRSLAALDEVIATVVGAVDEGLPAQR